MRLKRSFFVLATELVLCSLAFAASYPQVRIDVIGGVSGSITVELYTDKSPITCDNFIKYVKSGFYNDLIFHRVIKNFMIQGGGFDQYLTYKPPTYPAIINESTNRLSNVRGTIAMARTSAPDSATSQFFINDVNNTFLDYGAIAYDNAGNAYAKVGYCVFGKVISGMDVVDNIANVPTGNFGDINDVPITPIRIQGIAILTPVCIEKLAGDIDGDCSVNLDDFAMLAQDWLQNNSVVCRYNIVGDLNYDCIVNFEDFAMLGQNWMLSTSGPPCSTVFIGDINGDCRVDFKDLSILVSHWLESSL